MPPASRRFPAARAEPVGQPWARRWPKGSWRADHGVPQWNRVLLRLIDERDLNLVEAARLMAMAPAAGGDAMIACFDAKYHYRFWRPVHAIRRAGTDGNDGTAPDPTLGPPGRPPPTTPSTPRPTTVTAPPSPPP